jgi:hypothetical protein
VLPFFAKLPSAWLGWKRVVLRHWARDLIKPGHNVRLMPSAYVKAHMKRGKTDAGIVNAPDVNSRGVVTKAVFCASYGHHAPRASKSDLRHWPMRPLCARSSGGGAPSSHPTFFRRKLRDRAAEQGGAS